jgi:acetyl esterase/lipase
MDFSQYGGPSDEWLAVEKELPARTFDITMDPIVLRNAVNTEREGRAAEVMLLLVPHVESKDHVIPTRDGSTIEARTYRSVKKDASEKLPVYLYFHGGGFIFGNGFCSKRTNGCWLTMMQGRSIARTHCVRKPPSKPEPWY